MSGVPFEKNSASYILKKSARGTPRDSQLESFILGQSDSEVSASENEKIRPGTQKKANEAKRKKEEPLIMAVINAKCQRLELLKWYDDRIYSDQSLPTLPRPCCSGCSPGCIPPFRPNPEPPGTYHVFAPYLTRGLENWRKRKVSELYKDYDFPVAPSAILPDKYTKLIAMFCNHLTSDDGDTAFLHWCKYWPEAFEYRHEILEICRYVRSTLH